MKSNFTHSTRLFTIFLLFFLSFTTVSLAQIGPGIAPINTPSGGFNIDGTLIANTASGDWVDGTGTGGFILNNSGGALNTGTTYHLYDLYNTSSDNIFGGGDKVGDNPNNWTWTPGTANDKTDMNNALIHLTTDSNGNVWVVFAADRLSNSGNAYVDFEFLQTPMTKTSTGFATAAPASTGGRTLGDFLLTVYFENGVAKFDIQRWELIGSTWEYKTYFASLPLNSVFAAGNTSTVPVPYPAFGVNSYLQNTFIESAVNLTAVLGAIDPCTSLKIKTVFVKSKTSTSSSAAIKDFFNPVAIDNLTLGSSDAGDDATVCSGLPYTLQGSAVPSNGYEVISKTWSVLSGSATIQDPTNLNSIVNITGSSATFRLTVVTGPMSSSGSQCTVTDDVTITVNQPLTCSISGSDGPLCPSSTSNIYSAPVSANYAWSISGNGTIVGNTNTQSVSVTAGSGCNATFLLSLMITDANGCISTCTKTVTVIDETLPIVTNAVDSLNQTLQCNNTEGITAALALSPAATDNCTLAPTKVLVSDITTADADCTNAYVRVRTWNFTDGCGNTSANFVQTITVIDNTAPVVTTTVASLNQTLQCNNTEGITAALALSPAATDNCTLAPTKVLVSDVTTADANCTNAYVRVRTWNFTDGCGNTSANFVQTITVIDNTAPVVTTTAASLNQTLQCNNTEGITAALALSPAATDNCTLAPNKVLVSDVTTADANCTNAYVRVRTWNFTDGCGNTSADFVQTITVIDNTAPVVTTTAASLNQTLQCNNTEGITAALALSPAATDNCTLTPNKVLVSDVTSADANCTNAYVRVRTWNFTDGCGNTSADFVQTITVIDNTAPVVTTTAASLNQTLQCNNTEGITAALALSPAATDNCTLAPNKVLVSDVTTADADCTNAYVRVRTWNFTDGCGNTSANFVQTITVIDNTAPVVTTTAASLNQTLQCNNTEGITAALALSPAATDNCTLTPNKVLVSDVTTADADCTNAYVRVRTWNFTDGCGNTSADFVQTITVIDNTAPVVTTTADSLSQTLQCNNTEGITAALALSPAATDNCTLAPTKVLVSDVTTADANCTNAYIRVRTWNFTDGCGNTSANFVQTITVIDNTAPVVTTTAASLNQTLQCNNTEGITAALALSPAATDNCTLAPNKVLVSDVTTADANCTNAYVRVRTWNFTDGCGNTSADFVQTITVIDNTAPVVTTTAASLNQTLQCNNTEGITAALALSPAATDNCTLAPTKVLVSDVTTADANCTNAYVRVRTWNFTDGCGNTSANFVQTITVIDNIAPTFNESLPSNITVECKAVPVAKTLTATDNCGIARIDFSETETPGNCPGSSTILRTWIATDSCNNKTTHTQTIKVQDTTAPTFTTPADITISSDENCLADISTSSTGTVTNIQDNCDSNPLATYVDSECFGSFDEQEINAGNGNYFPFTISGFDNLTAANIEKISLAFETNQGKGRAEFILVAPSGQAIKLVGPYCEGGECDDESSNTQELYLPVFYPNSSGYTKWNNNDFIQDGINQNLIPNGETTSSNSILGVSSFVSSFEEFTGSMNGDWFVYSKKQANVNGSVKFKSVCLKPTSLCVGNKVISRTWTVTDACGNKATSTQTIKIIDASSPTWITGADALNTSIECNNPEALANAQSLSPIAKDNCDTDVSNITKVSGAFVPSSECANAGTYTNTWTVNDDCGNTSAVFTQVITIQDTTAPTWSTQATALNTTVECSNAEALATAQAAFPAAADLCDTDVSNITKVSGAFVPSSECANAGTYTNTWTVNDDCGNTSAVFTQVITIQDTTAPTWSTQATALNTTVECSDAEALATAQAAFPAAADLCDTDVSNITKVSGAFVPSSECANSGTYTNTWTVNDDCGNTSAVFTQVITIQDTTAPTWSTLATALNTTVECSDAEALATAQAAFPAAADLCDTDVSNITKVSGAFVPSSECANAGTYTNTWTVNDDCGNTSAVFTQVITIQDTTTPTWSTLATALNTTVECSDTVALATAQAAFPAAADLCDTDVSNITKVSGAFVPSSECANAGTYTNTWTVNDDCGNTSAVFTQVITIQDTTAPTWSTQATALNTTVECSDAEALATAQAAFPAAADLCDTDVSNITKVSGAFVPSSECANAGTYTNTWTVNDDCGNTSAVFTQVITIQDTTAPTWSTQATALDTTVECSDAEALATAQAAIPTAADLCDTDVSNITKVSGAFVPSSECANAGTYTNTWTVNDDCGNTSAVFTQVITIQDTTAPTWSTQATALDTTVECSNAEALATAQAAFPAAADLCDTDVSNITKVSGAFVPSSECANSGTYTNTWTVNDDCGNTSAVFTQVITIQDTKAPTWSTQATALNTTVECSDAEALATAQAAFPAAADLCDTDVSNITKVSGAFVPSSECANSGTYTNTWTVNDDCGNTSAVFTQVITIQDTTAPIINTTASNITVECDSQGNQNAIADWLSNNGGATASDNCSDVTWSNNFNTLSNDCSTAVTVLFTAKDACGNSSTTSATFSVKDTTAPIAPEAPATITVACATDVPVSTTLTAIDNCNGEITAEGIDVIAQGDCPNSFVITRTWTFTDACSNSSSTSQIINVIDTTAPVISALPEISTISCPATPEFTQAIATDNCGSTVTLTFADVTTNGQCAGSYSVTRTWTATDACGNAASASQTINVQDTAAPVIAALPETTTISCPATPEFNQAIATDGCGSTITLTFADVTTNGQCAGSYSVTRTWTATDACGNASTATQTINVQDTAAPVIAALPETSTISCPATPEFTQAIATDGCGSTVTLTFADVTTNGQCAGSYSVTRTWTATDACGNASTATQTINVQDTTAPVIAALPSASTISCPAIPEFTQAIATDGCGSTVTLTFADVTTNGQCAGSYSVTRTWTATDACGNAASASQTINVQDTAAPVIAALPEISTISCPATPEFTQAIATDGCGSTVTLIFADVTTNGQCTGSYSVTRTWTATDACGNASTATQTINVQDTAAPVIAALPETSTISCPATPEFTQAIATDGCGSTLTLTFADVTTNGQCAGSYSVTRTWTATDACGNVSTATQTINVQDTAAPVIAALPETSTISCPATPEFTQAIATDGCGSTVTLTFADVTTNGQCAGSYSVTRTWTATDACGNAASASQTINVQDTTAPVIAALPETSTISCPAIPEFTQAIATDGCGSTVTLTFADVTTNGQCAGSYSVTRTWTATDACGNAASVSQTINVQDTTAPVIAALPSASTISCPATPVFAQAIATDGCGSIVTLTFADVTTNGQCAGSYSVTRTWTATDACGNASTATQTINIVDTVGPTTATQFSSTVNVNCDAIPAKPELVFVDNCSTVSPAIFTENIINRTENSYSIVRKWSVADTCGNVSEFTQIINVTIPNSVVTISSSICNDGEITTTNLNDLLPVGTPTNGTWVDVNNSGGLQGSTLNAAGLSVRDYTFEYKINDATCPRTIRITMTVNTGCGGIVLACGTVLVHNAFSPNGDGINEKFIIDNIDDTVCYPENTVEIYNRWGVLVYETKGYNNASNSFDGISGGRSTVQQSSGLPTGTYFYILNYTSVDNDGKIITNKKDGYLYLTK